MNKFYSIYFLYLSLFFNLSAYETLVHKRQESNLRENESYLMDEDDDRANSVNSFDSLISSQCKARCLSLYPWKLGPTPDTINDVSSLIYENDDQDGLSPENWLLLSRTQRQKNNNEKLRANGGLPFASSHHSMTQNEQNQRLNVRWNKVMELCAKNSNCLQCSLPCEIPKNLLENCKYLCKNNHPLCIQSCNLLVKLNSEKYGTCPVQAIPQFSSLKCSNDSTSQRHNRQSQTAIITSTIAKCNQDSDCMHVKKCCPINPQCPQLGNVCQRPVIDNVNLPSIPFNLTIVERKKGKTVILSWDCKYNKNKATMFVVEGRWSLKSPTEDTQMTKWGYLAQTVNNNWIILRNINRGRWYKFRVAAISKSGTHGYSQPTDLFILSSPPKPASSPLNFTLNRLYSVTNDQVNADLTWLPPKKSDLPLSHFKISWQLRRFPNNSMVDYDLEEKMSDFDLVEAQRFKYTIRNLIKNAIYNVRLVAESKYETTILSSIPIDLRIDTSNFSPMKTAESFAASLISSSASSNYNHLNEEYEQDDDESGIDETPTQSKHEDDDVDKLNLITRNSPLKQPIISNLTVHTPYFQNGLVKAKLSWLFQHSALDQIDQLMFTLTWFPIKCINQKQMPTPITATTINNFFEIYELKYNCDYVVNIRLAKQSSESKVASQVLSSQFKVPSCAKIGIVGRIRPMCYESNLFNENLYDLLFTTTKSNSNAPVEVTTSKTTSTITTPQTTEKTIEPQINDLSYRVLKRTNKFYTVEFSWSMPEEESLNLNAYQISLVPRAIPGMIFDNTFGSIGAILNKDQRQFVVRHLRAKVNYIFQVQPIGTDNQLIGLPGSLEFLIDQDLSDEASLQKHIKQASSSTQSANSFYNNNSNKMFPNFIFYLVLVFSSLLFYLNENHLK